MHNWIRCRMQVANLRIVETIILIWDQQGLKTSQAKVRLLEVRSRNQAQEGLSEATGWCTQCRTNLIINITIWINSIIWQMEEVKSLQAISDTSLLIKTRQHLSIIIRLHQKILTANPLVQPICPSQAVSSLVARCWVIKVPM